MNENGTQCHKTLAVVNYLLSIITLRGVMSMLEDSEVMTILSHV